MQGDRQTGQTDIGHSLHASRGRAQTRVASDVQRVPTGVRGASSESHIRRAAGGVRNRAGPASPRPYTAVQRAEACPACVTGAKVADPRTEPGDLLAPGRRHSSAHAYGARAALPEPGIAVGREAPPREHPRQRVLRRRWRRDTSRPEGAAPAPVPDWVCPWGDASVASGPDHLRFYGLLLTCHAPARESQVPKSPRSAHSAAQGRSCGSALTGAIPGDSGVDRRIGRTVSEPLRRSHSAIKPASASRRSASAAGLQNAGHRRPGPCRCWPPPWDGTGERS